MQLTNPFATLRDGFEPLIKTERLLLGLFAATAISATVAPVLWPQQPKEVKLIENIWGLFSSVCFTAECHRRRTKEKTYQSYEDANHVVVTEYLKGTLAREAAIAKMKSKHDVADYVNTEIPEHQRLRWVQEYPWLNGLVDLPQVQQAVIEEQQTPQLKPVFNGSTQSSIDSISDDLAVEVDYTWMDAEFINGSKVVYGPKGSGKSVYLAYEAIAFLTHFPNGELRIGDKHYDEDKSVWLPGIPPDVLLDKFVAKKPEQILGIFRSAKQKLDDRIERGIKEGHPECKPFKFICDEFEGVMLKLADNEREEVIKIIEQTQDEGRKYLINITLGTHSLKEKRIKIDSSVLFQMDVLCLGSALADPHTSFPADFDKKPLLSQQMELQRILKPKQGFACVVRKLGEMAKVQVIPFLDLNKFSFEYQKPSIDPYEILTDWIQKLGRNPSDNELNQAWEQITGEQLTSDALTLLKTKLDLH